MNLDKEEINQCCHNSVNMNNTIASVSIELEILHALLIATQLLTPSDVQRDESHELCSNCGSTILRGC